MPASSFWGAVGKAVVKHGLNALAGGFPLGDAVVGVAEDAIVGVW